MSTTKQPLTSTFMNQSCLLKYVALLTLAYALKFPSFTKHFHLDGI